MELQLARTLPHVDELVSWLFRGLERKRSENQGHGVLGKTCVLMSSPDMQMGLCVWAQSMQMLVSQKQGGSMTPSVMSPSICTFGNPSEAVMAVSYTHLTLPTIRA